MVKGVLRGDDAVRCLDAGAEAIYVSNHGGRQLDRAVDTATALREVVAAVGDRAEVYVDGGIRAALDVLAALALGARAVFVGRPALYALAVGRCPRRRAAAHASCPSELAEALVLAGCGTPDDARDLLAESSSRRPLTCGFDACGPAHATPICDAVGGPHTVLTCRQGAAGSKTARSGFRPRAATQLSTKPFTGWSCCASDF